MDTLLIIDDEKSVRYSFERMFEDEYQVMTAADGCSALDVISNADNRIDVVMLDVRMPGMDGIEVLKLIKEKRRNIPVVVMTAFSASNTAIEAMKEGAYDYLIKPLEYGQLKEIIERAVASSRLQSEAYLCSEIDEYVGDVETIVGNSPAILDVCKMIGQAAGSEVPVLISGESGVGKEIVARAIYNHSSRKGGPFMAVNCAALPDGVVESELFGFEKGAFTGAEKKRIGRFEQCNRGVIFLDEIGDMNLQTQAKLLRILQDGKFERVGSNETIYTDVRIIAASNRNLNGEVKQGRFREDLFHRLNVFAIYIRPLRERKEDIPILAEYFISRAVKESDKTIRGVSPEVVSLLKSYNWPGNVRELENVIRRAAVVASSEIIDVEDINLNPDHYGKELKELSDIVKNILDRETASGKPANTYHNLISSVEKTMVEHALGISGGNQVKASELLGITRVTLRKKIDEYGIQSV